LGGRPTPRRARVGQHKRGSTVELLRRVARATATDCANARRLVLAAHLDASLDLPPRHVGSMRRRARCVARRTPLAAHSPRRPSFAILRCSASGIGNSLDVGGRRSVGSPRTKRPLRPVGQLLLLSSRMSAADIRVPRRRATRARRTRLGELHVEQRRRPRPMATDLDREIAAASF